MGQTLNYHKILQKAEKKKNKGSLGCEPLMKFETYQNDPFDGDFHAHHIGKMQ
jgi:hypothetical protein